MSKLTKKLSLGAETDVASLEPAFDSLRRDLLMLEPPPDAEVKVAITVQLPFGLQQRLPFVRAQEAVGAGR